VATAVVKRFSPGIRFMATRPSARPALILVLLFAFLAQTQLAATHFHLGIDAKEQILFGLAENKAPAKGKAPLGDRDCPISQLVAANHNYLAGSSLAVPASPLVASVLHRTPDEAPLLAPITRNWQSRAPPRDLATA
jgi:hypothetical protein